MTAYDKGFLVGAAAVFYVILIEQIFEPWWFELVLVLAAAPLLGWIDKKVDKP